MPTRFKSQYNFNAGELSPRLYGRSDINKYDNGLKTATNCNVLPHGPVVRRNGTKYVAEVKTSSSEVRLIKFQFDQDTAYILEFGNLYIRFYKDQGQLQSGGSPYEIVSPYTAAQVQDLSYVQFGNFLYIAHGSHETRKLTRTADTDWTLDTLNAFPPPTYESGYSPSATCTPGATTGTGVTFTASSGVFLKGDVGRQIKNLEGAGRASIVSFTDTSNVVCDIVEDFPSTSAIASGDWVMDLSPIADLTPNGTKLGSIINITADEADSNTALNTFRSDDVGKYILIHGGVAQITTINSASDIDAEVLKSLTAKDETAAWTLETETWTATRGYPTAIGLFEERLVLGGTIAQPQTIWFSETGIFNGFGTGADDDDSIEVTLGSSEANKIQWIAAARDLAVGTSGSESTINANGQSGITPSNISQVPRTYHGSNVQQPVISGNEIIFFQGSQRKVRTFRYDFNVDTYIGEDLTFLNEHLTEGLIVEIAYAQEPDNIIYAVLDNGDMLAGTYKRDQEVIGWTKWTTTGSFEHVATISEGNQDEVWVVVNRTIDGATARYIELLDNGNGEDRLDGYSDSYLTYTDAKTITGATAANPVVITSTAHGYSDGDTIKIIDVVGMTELNGKSYKVANKTANTFELTDTSDVNIDGTSYTAYTSGGEAHELVSTISGLDHLEGESVEVKVDGASHPARTVASGAITLAQSAYEVTVGIAYTTTITTLDIDADFGAGRTRTAAIRHVYPSLLVYKSYPATINGNVFESRSAADKMDEKVPLFTGFYDYDQLSFDAGSSLSLVFTGPFPFFLNGIYTKVEGNNK